jgi:peroxiredoxin
MHRRVMLALLGVTLLPAATYSADAAQAKVTILARDQALVIDDAVVDGDELLVPARHVQAITGFEMKAEGMCSGSVCYFPADASWKSERDGTAYFNLTRFAKKMDQVYAVDRERGVWSFTSVPHSHVAPLMTGVAPDFALPDRAGKTVRLSDFRGKKVLLVTWASWCGCRLDITGWQKVYEDLKDKNFEIISVAQDTGGAAVAEPWFERGKPTYTCLVDVDHTVSSLYQMVNVPMGVWIDESGRIVRPAEVAYSKQMTFVGTPAGDDRYGLGVRDWVEKGADSIYLLPQEKLQPRLALRSPELRLADAHFKLATYLTRQDQKEAAASHFREAQKLDPSNWNYHRQDWSFEPKTALSKWFAKVRGLNGKPYYDPVEFPKQASSAQE